MTWAIYWVAAALAAGWIGCGVALLPAVRYRVASGPDSAKPRWAAAALVSETVQLILAALCLSAVATWITAWAITLGPGTSSVAVAATIRRIESFERLLGDVKIGICVVAFCLAAVALVYWIWKRRRAQFAEARNALVRAQIDRLIEQFNRNELPTLEPTAEMKPEFERLAMQSNRVGQVEQEIEATDDPIKREELQALLKQLADSRRSMFENLARMDILRRVEVPPYDPDLVGLPPPPKSISEKVGRIFISRGVFRYLGKGQRALLVASMLLAVPSLITVTGDALSAQLDAKITNLDQLRVNLAALELQDRFNAAVQQPALPSDPATAVDDTTFADMARAHAVAFEGALARGLEDRFHITAIDSSVPNAEPALRRENARERILHVIADHANGGPSSPADPGDNPVPPSGREVAVHRASLSGDGSEGLHPAPGDLREPPVHALAQRLAATPMLPSMQPQTPAGKSLEVEIIRRGRTNAAFRTRIVEGFREAGRSFFEAARPAHLRAVMIVAALGGSNAITTDAIAQPIAEWASAVMEPGFSARAYQASSQTYMDVLLRTGDAGKAVDAVEHSPDNFLLRVEADVAHAKIIPRLMPDDFIAAQLDRAAPGLVELHDGITKDAEREKALNQFYHDAATHQPTPLSSGEIRDLIASASIHGNYEHYFPSDLGDPGEAGHGIIPPVPSAGGGGGAGTVAREGGGGFSKMASVTRARSFARLNGFSRVGGVLIGRDPEGSDKLDIRDLSWRVQDGKITLNLTGDDHSKTVIGPVPEAIVSLAMGYAADGRAVAATMTKAEPLAELRILLHPVLVDTPIGARAIEIDRFVDESSADSAIREERTLLVEVQRSLYAMARRELVSAVLGTEETRFADRLIGLDDDVAGLADTIDAAPDDKNGKMARRVLKQALADPRQLFDQEFSPLKVKTEYFHPTIVQLMQGCAKPNGDLAAYKSCVKREAQALALTSTDELKSRDNLNWTAPTPRVQPWSGVREQAYALDQHMAFAGVGHTGDPPPEPFDFIVQVSFTSPPYAAMTTPWFDKDGDAEQNRRLDEEAEKKDPWLFPDRDLQTTAQVVSLIAHDPKSADVFAGMRQFVWLERLFRAGLSGRLGVEFPVERLAQLAKETAGSVEKQRTPRWNVRTPSELPFLAQLLTTVKSGANRGTQAQMSACLRAVGIDVASVGNDRDATERAVVRARVRLYDISDDAWDEACRFAEGTVSPELAELSARVSNLRRLRHAVGIRADEALMEARGAWKPL
jgi:hypothetical protein